MKVHPLKIISLTAIAGLLLSQLGLIFWSLSEYRILMTCLLTAPLLLPLKGLINNQRYTYKWVGFLTLMYIAIGISESFSNPQLRLYSTLTLFFSSLLFISSIYYSRYLR